VKRDLQQQARYYDALTDIKAENMDYEKKTNANLLSQLDQLEKTFSATKPAVPENGTLTDTVVLPIPQDRTKNNDTLNK
jgi:hypothetical protein